MTSPLSKFKLQLHDNPGLGKQITIAVAICWGIWAAGELLAGHRSAATALAVLGLLTLLVPPVLASARRWWLTTHIRHEADADTTVQRISELYKPSLARAEELKTLEEIWALPMTEEPKVLS